MSIHCKININFWFVLLHIQLCGILQAIDQNKDHTNFEICDCTGTMTGQIWLVNLSLKHIVQPSIHVFTTNTFGYATKTTASPLHEGPTASRGEQTYQQEGIKFPGPPSVLLNSNLFISRASRTRTNKRPSTLMKHNPLLQSYWEHLGPQWYNLNGYRKSRVSSFP